MKKMFYIIINNILSVISIKKIISIIFIFISINFITTSIYDINNLNDIFKFSFYGVNSIGELPIELFKGTLCNMYLVYIALSLSNNKLNNRSRIIILRIGNRQVWINGLIFSILIICLIYYSIGFSTLTILNYKYLGEYINLINIVDIFFLMILSGFSFCMISLLIGICIKDESTVFTIIVSLYYISISIGNVVTSLDKYLIFNQGMLIKYSNSSFSFMWAYFYNIIFSLIVYLCVKIISTRIDI